MLRLAVRVAGGVVLCGALASVVGCDGHMVGPTPLVSTPWIKIAGATTLNQPGDTSQLTATLISSDGTAKDVTNVATWSGSGSVVTVRGGLVTAIAYGRGSIKATANGLTGSSGVSVLPAGTYLVQGRVIAAGGPVAQAGVEVTSPSGTASATTDGSGLFALPGQGPVTVRARMAGYQETVQPLTVDRDMTFVEIVLIRLGDTAGNIRGSYTLTFTASPSCTLPPAAMQRTYAVRIEEGRFINRPQNLIVTPIDARNFVAWGDAGFTGALLGTTVRFDLTDDFSADYVLIERIGGVDLYYSGTATGTVSENVIDTTFGGTLTARSYPGSSLIGECTASDHRLKLVR